MSTVSRPIRIDKNLWDSFVISTKNNDSDASKELRKFIKKYVAQHAQKDLLK